jgi:hypothetical protein
MLEIFEESTLMNGKQETGGLGRISRLKTYSVNCKLALFADERAGGTYAMLLRSAGNLVRRCPLAQYGHNLEQRSKSNGSIHHCIMSMLFKQSLSPLCPA